jgi:hypothetical protein
MLSNLKARSASALLVASLRRTASLKIAAAMVNTAFTLFALNFARSSSRSFSISTTVDPIEAKIAQLRIQMQIDLRAPRRSCCVVTEAVKATSLDGVLIDTLSLH